MIQSFKDLKVYQLSYSLAAEIFWATKSFPKEELSSLTDHLRRSSRSVAVNIAEGWAKRHFKTYSKGTLLIQLAHVTKRRYGCNLL